MLVFLMIFLVILLLLFLVLLLVVVIVVVCLIKINNKKNEFQLSNNIHCSATTFDCKMVLI